MDKKKRFIIMVSIFIVGIVGLIVTAFFSAKNYIKEEAMTNYYTEKEVNDLAYLLKELYEHDYTEEEKHQMAIYYLLKTPENHDYYFTMYGNVEGEISELIKEINLYSGDNQRDEYYFNGHLIKKGDYHELALAIIEDYNSTLHDKNVASDLEEAETTLEVIILITFILLYAFVILRFVLLKEFNKKSIKKDIAMYGVTLLALFILNILSVIIYEKAINYLGSYMVRAYQIGNASDIFEYGILTPLNLLIVFIISVLLYLVINYKEIKKNMN